MTRRIVLAFAFVGANIFNHLSSRLGANLGDGRQHWILHSIRQNCFFTTSYKIDYLGMKIHYSIADYVFRNLDIFMIYY